MAEKKSTGRPSWTIPKNKMESCEWLNKIIKGMWPYIAKFVEKTLVTSVGPMVEDKYIPAFLKPFRFDTVNFGNKPLRVEGMTVFNDTPEDDEIIIDLDVKYDGNCFFNISLRGMPAGIENIKLTAKARIVIKPLIADIPIIGGMSMFLLTKPTFSFDMRNIASVIDLPMIKEIVVKLVEEIIQKMMVNPNKMAFALNPSVDIYSLKCPPPQGVLRIHINKAAELKAANTYCKLVIAGYILRTAASKSSVADPVWDEYFQTVIDYKEGMEAIFTIHDINDEQKALCRGTVEVEAVFKRKFIDGWVPLENVKTGAGSGKIHIRAQWTYPTRNPKNFEKPAVFPKGPGKEKLHQFLLAVYIDTVKGLPRVKPTLEEPSSFCRISVAGQILDSVPQKGSINPGFKQTAHFLIESAKDETLRIFIMNPVGNIIKAFGEFSMPVSEIIKAPEMIIGKQCDLKDKANRSFEPPVQFYLRAFLRGLVDYDPMEELIYKK